MSNKLLNVWYVSDVSEGADILCGVMMTRKTYHYSLQEHAYTIFHIMNFQSIFKMHGRKSQHFRYFVKLCQSQFSRQLCVTGTWSKSLNRTIYNWGNWMRKTSLKKFNKKKEWQWPEVYRRNTREVTDSKRGHLYSHNIKYWQKTNKVLGNAELHWSCEKKKVWTGSLGERSAHGLVLQHALMTGMEAMQSQGGWTSFQGNTSENRKGCKPATQSHTGQLKQRAVGAAIRPTLK